MEKCYGVAKAGKNDCQTANSSCAGTSKKDAQARRLDLGAQGRLREDRRRQAHRRLRHGPSPASVCARRIWRRSSARGRRPASSRSTPRTISAARRRLAQSSACGADYALSIHAVGLSLGSADGLDEAHLARVAALVEAARAGVVCPTIFRGAARRALFQRPAAAALYRRGARRRCRAMCTACRTCWAGRSRWRTLPAISASPIDDAEPRVPRRAGPAQRLRLAARCEQHRRHRAQSAARSDGLARWLAGPRRSRNITSPAMP